MTEQTADGIWADVAARLRADLSDTAFSAWFGSATPVAMDGHRLRVGVPNEFTRAWIAGHFAELVARAARSTQGDLAVEFSVEAPAGAATAQPLSTARPAAPRVEHAQPDAA